MYTIQYIWKVTSQYTEMILQSIWMVWSKYIEHSVSWNIENKTVFQKLYMYLNICIWLYIYFKLMNSMNYW